MNTHPYLDESLQRDINHIQAKVTEMAALTENALKSSVHALTNRNRQQAYSIILRDQYIDELETELDRLCLEFLARHQPVAQQLRFVFSTIQINRELERIGDYAESIARQILVVSALEPQPPYDKFVELGDLAIHMLRDAVRSFLEQDGNLAKRTMVIEERANSLRNSINADLKDLTEANKLPAASFTPLLTIARRLERVTDQAKNLCEDVLYMCTGEFAKHTGWEGFRILFVDSTNNCLSQMAEAIGTAMHEKQFTFRSAGVTPQPLDVRAVEFMASKGIDISRQTSKSLEQVPGWGQYQVIVTFSPQVREALSAHPGKTVLFTWSIQDPLKVEGPSEAFRSAFEAAYLSLESQIRELVGAILLEPQPELKL